MSPWSAYIFSMDGHSEKLTVKSGSVRAILYQTYLCLKLIYIMECLFAFVFALLFYSYMLSILSWSNF